MNETQTSVELAARCDWALALIAELVNSGREAGWLTGPPLPVVDVDVARVRANASSADTAMHQIASRLSVSDVELDVLWLLACIELDPRVAHAVQLLVPSGLSEPSAQIIERLVGRGDVLMDDVFDRLDRWSLALSDARVPLNRRAVRLHPRVLDAIRGHLRLDRSVANVASLSDEACIRRTGGPQPQIPSALRNALSHNQPALCLVTGIEGTGRATLLRNAASACGHSVLTIQSRALAEDDIGLAQQLRAIVRECTIHNAWPLFIDIEALSTRLSNLDRAFPEDLGMPVFGTSAETIAWPTKRPVVALRLAIPEAPEREEIWRSALPESPESVVQQCAHRYAISPGLINRAASAAQALAGVPATVEAGHVHLALRAHLDRRLAGMARRIETTQTWDDLVLPNDQIHLLIEIAARAKFKQRVLDDWGFADKVGRGHGLSALFSGPPGTGKTMIAGLLADELGLDLYQVDLSKVVSKYIGETEKQLAALFEAGESGHAILLFDEADSLFAKRTEVKSSNDRYANLEVNYLLQRIEAFSGIAILTTNHETAIDQAFLRRLAFHVRVPMPEEDERERIWMAMFPPQAVRAEGIDFAGLAQKFEMSGGYIKNAVLRAAFLCAAEGSPITNGHLQRAARAEYETMGMLSFNPTRISQFSA